MEGGQLVDPRQMRAMSLRLPADVVDALRPDAGSTRQSRDGLRCGQDVLQHGLGEAAGEGVLLGDVEAAE